MLITFCHEAKVGENQNLAKKSKYFKQVALVNDDVDQRFFLRFFFCGNKVETLKADGFKR